MPKKQSQQRAEPVLVSVRTPAYRRPAMLKRALASIIAQDVENWRCDVYDDDPAGSGREVCDAFGDSRIIYHHNQPQLFASRNIDHCFTAENPHHAEFFCVVEDDNYLLPGFFAENIAICRERQVELVLRNQLFEYASGTEAAHLGDEGVLDGLFTEGLYAPDRFRMSLLCGIGVSNGGLFWSRRAKSQLEIQYFCTATMQEYMRTFSIVEPIYVAMKPLAVWAENAGQTTRNADLKASYLRRELDLKRSVQALRRHVWKASPAELRRAYLTDPVFATAPAERATALRKALISHGSGGADPRVSAEMVARGVAIRMLGRLQPELKSFIRSRQASWGAQR
jgi:glycosyltransferase involved in cell wall biosynthesis